MPQARAEDNISIKRKQLTFRSWHRGTREVDLLLGRFADECLASFDGGQLMLYDRFLNNSDPDIFNWLTKTEPVPDAENTAVARTVVEFFNKEKK